MRISDWSSDVCSSDLQKPDGLTILMPDDIAPRLATELVLTDLPGIGRNMERRLRLQGIHTIADILALDRRSMRSVWGSIWGERMWYLQIGRASCRDRVCQDV